MEELPGYDAWKTATPPHWEDEEEPAEELEEVFELARRKAREAWDAAADFRSLCRSLGDDGPDPDDVADDAYTEVLHSYGLVRYEWEPR